MNDFHENTHIALVALREGGEYQVNPLISPCPVWSPWGTTQTLDEWKPAVLSNARANGISGVFFCHMTDVYYLKDGHSEHFRDAVKDYPEEHGYAKVYNE